MNKFFATTAAIAAFVPSAAFAQDADNSGFTVGVVGGLDVINLEDSTDSVSESGVLYGVFAGYDVASGNTVFGVEAEASGTSVSNDLSDAGLDLYGGIRLGLRTDDNSTVYVKAGYTNVDIDAFDNLEGVRFGAGYEHDFGSAFARLEYRYSSYNVSDLVADDVNSNRHQVAVALGTRF